MTDPVISIERLSDELMDAYLVSGMERGKAGRFAVGVEEVVLGLGYGLGLEARRVVGDGVG